MALRVSDGQLKRLWEAFRKYDLNGDSELDRNELINVLKTQTTDLNAELEVDEMMNKLDKNKDGEVNFVEFFKGYADLLTRGVDDQESAQVHQAVNDFLEKVSQDIGEPLAVKTHTNIDNTSVEAEEEGAFMAQEKPEDIEIVDPEETPSSSETQTIYPTTSTQTIEPDTSEIHTQTSTNSNETHTQTTNPVPIETQTQTQTLNTLENETQTSVPNTFENQTQTVLPPSQETQTSAPNLLETQTQTNTASTETHTQTQPLNTLENETQTIHPLQIPPPQETQETQTSTSSTEIYTQTSPREREPEILPQPNYNSDNTNNNSNNNDNIERNIERKEIQKNEKSGLLSFIKSPKGLIRWLYYIVPSMLLIVGVSKFKFKR
eukprot:TRINITY_DN665_c0_g2_i1.p1 TRINITY_DN665_c0_g2~~TRINITY_DN665_c0_g2_i1.p1  ORF type:complete len:378 (-),score=112.13 TRINITY_DN665_c0_g2_i1:52-1185(-)